MDKFIGIAAGTDFRPDYKFGINLASSKETNCEDFKPKTDNHGA